MCIRDSPHTTTTTITPRTTTTHTDTDTHTHTHTHTHGRPPLALITLTCRTPSCMQQVTWLHVLSRSVRCNTDATPSKQTTVPLAVHHLIPRCSQSVCEDWHTDTLTHPHSDTTPSPQSAVSLAVSYSTTDIHFESRNVERWQNDEACIIQIWDDLSYEAKSVLWFQTQSSLFSMPSFWRNESVCSEHLPGLFLRKLGHITGARSNVFADFHSPERYFFVSLCCEC